jgi:hypothetical protein
MPITFRSTFAGRLRNRLFALIAHIREMVFQAGLDTAAPRLNICAILFDVRCTSLPDGTRLYSASWQPKEKSLKRILMHAARLSPLVPAQ